MPDDLGHLEAVVRKRLAEVRVERQDFLAAMEAVLPKRIPGPPVLKREALLPWQMPAEVQTSIIQRRDATRRALKAGTISSSALLISFSVIAAAVLRTFFP